MCVVSMISDWGRQKWPRPDPWLFPPTTLPRIPTPQEYRDYQELVRKAREYDRIHQQPDCPDPEKLKWQAWLDGQMRARSGLTPTEKLAFYGATEVTPGTPEFDKVNPRPYELDPDGADRRDTSRASEEFDVSKTVTTAKTTGSVTVRRTI